MSEYTILDFSRDYDPNPVWATHDPTVVGFCRECYVALRVRRDHCPSCVDRLDRLWKLLSNEGESTPPEYEPIDAIDAVDQSVANRLRALHAEGVRPLIIFAWFKGILAEVDSLKGDNEGLLDLNRRIQGGLR